MTLRSCLSLAARPAVVVLVVLVLLAPAGLYGQTRTETPSASGETATPKSLDELLAIQRKVEAIAGRALPATVGVRVGTSQGSGVIISPDGYVLTAGHVLGRPGQAANVILTDGRVLPAKTLGVYTTADAGLLKIDGEGPWPALERGHSRDIPAGTWCVAVGHPLGYQEGRPPVVRLGRVLRIQDNQIQTDCPLVAGDSGGPLLDLEGQVIGVNSRIGGSTDMNYHIPVDVFAGCWTRLARGDAWEDQLPRKESGDLQAVVGQVTAGAARCVVRIECQGRAVALGTIVGSDGWILTKASELNGSVVCHFNDGRRLKAVLIGTDKRYDLALLQVLATDLPRVPWSTASESPVGQWVAAPGLGDEKPLALGVVSVPRRRIPPVRGILGVGVGRGEGGALVARVIPDTPAERAGLREKDLITHLDGQSISDQEKFVESLHERAAGDVVRLVVRRGQTTLQLAVTLEKLDTPGSRKREIQNSSEIGVSRRHDDFPLVLQHDTVLRPSECGGPLVDLSGRVVGINVARGGRTETYAVPTDVLLPLLAELKRGESDAPRVAAAPRAEHAATDQADEIVPTPRETHSSTE